jgi:FkbM family methyltransferase
LKKIFLDVGANTGQSLMAALDRDFDKIVCFEPAPICWPFLEKLKDKRTHIERFGLWNRTTQATIYDPGTKGSGLWVKDKRKAHEKPITHATCDFRRATDWFKANLTKPAIVYLKLNCEGAECDILDDLLDSGEFDKVTYAMVDFDSRKITDLKHREAETRARLAGISFPRIAYCKDVMVGQTHQDRIHNWLRLVDEAANP